MRTVTYRLDDLKDVVIHIGRAGENLATRVRIDAGKVFAEYPAAVPTMKVINPAGTVYGREVSRDGDLVIWDVTESDLAAEGQGEMQLTFTENSVIVKSVNALTEVCRSISGGTTPPDPVQDWVDHAEEVLEEIEDAFPEGGTTGQVLAKKSDADFDTEWVDQGAGGTTDYTDLENKPQIGGVTLSGNKSLSDLGAASAADVSAKYTKPSGGIPASDIADGVIPDPEDLIDDTAGAGDTEKVWSADKSAALLRAIDELPVSDAIEQIGITWDQIDKYRMADGTYIETAWFYECRINAIAGEKYYVTGKSYYEMCLYYVENSSGNIIAETHFSNEEALHENIEVIIPANGVKLVLQARATGRDDYQLKKVVGKKLSDGSVSYQTLTNELQTGVPTDAYVNLYNKEDPDIITGKYLNSDNSMGNSANMNISGYIPVEYGKTYCIPAYTNFFGTSSPKYVCAYGADKTFMYAITGTLDTTKRITTFAPDTPRIKYVRVNVAPIGSTANVAPHLNGECFMLTESPYPTGYFPYGDIKTFGNNVYLNAESESRFNPLFRKSVVFAGDSICNGASANDQKNGWAGRIGRNNEMLWINKGISGATLTAGLTGSYGVISETNFDNADYLIIEGGTNDADLIGDARSTTPEKFGSFTLADYTSTFENTTFCGAIEYLFKKLVNDYKGKKIGVIIAPKMGQLNASTTDYTKEHNNKRCYFETLMQLCEKWGVPYLNLWDHSIFNPMASEQYVYQQSSSVGKFYTDGQHLTTEGYDVISTVIEAWMKTL